MASLHPTAQRVADHAREIGLDLQVHEFQATTRTAEDAANAIGCQVGQIVKSLLFTVDGQPTMTLVSGANQLDEKKLAGLCGVGRKKVRRADADMVREITGFAIGGVPPFGHRTRLRTFVDEDFFGFDTIWAAAGTANAVFPIAPEELARITDGERADLKAQR